MGVPLPPIHRLAVRVQTTSWLAAHAAEANAFRGIDEGNVG